MLDFKLSLSLVSRHSLEGCFYSGYLQKSSKLEKEVEEKVKKPRFNILVPQRRPSRIETTPGNIDYHVLFTFSNCSLD